MPDGMWEIFLDVVPEPPIRSRYGPRRRPAKLHADKGYDFDHLRNWLRRRQIVPRIARRGVEASSRLGRHRWSARCRG